MVCASRCVGWAWEWCSRCSSSAPSAGEFIGRLRFRLLSVRSAAECHRPWVSSVLLWSSSWLRVYLLAMVRVCACRGEGKIVDPADKCTACGGEKIVRERKQLEVHIEKGMRHGSKITMTEEGDQEPGNFVLIFNQRAALRVPPSPHGRHSPRRPDLRTEADRSRGFHS